MKCTVCSSEMRQTATDLPFKLADRAIVIVKDLPLFQCTRCREYLFVDATLARIDELLAKVDVDAEVEIIRFAA